ncbi:MAG: hypothetical protein GY782_02945 [Gammaproteobacteria bacterium]|nr:hypothetical protein [Gammaproteobacteria bacterium]
MKEAARHMEDSRKYNMVKGQHLTPLTAKWDHHFIVTGVQGKVITVLHVPTGKSSKWNRNKIRLVDPETCWEGMKIRPKAQNVNAPPQASRFNTPLNPDNHPHLLLPQHDETACAPPRTARKRHAPDRQYDMDDHTNRTKVQREGGNGQKRHMHEDTDSDDEEENVQVKRRQPSRASTTKRAGTSGDVQHIPTKQRSTRPESVKRNFDEDDHTPRVTNKRYNFRQTPSKRALLDYEYEDQAKRRDCRTPAVKRTLPQGTSDQPSKKPAPSNQANAVSATSNQRRLTRYTGEQWAALHFTAAFWSR